jgi:hypothetical protein
MFTPRLRFVFEFVGAVESVELDPKTGTVRLGLAAATQFTLSAHLRIGQPAKVNRHGNL